MEFSIVNYDNIRPNLFRLDSEYHVGIKKLDLSGLLGNTLDELCSKIVQGPNPNFIENGIPCLNGKNVYFGTLDAGEPNHISEDEYNNFKSYQLFNNDIVITLKHASRVGRLWIYKGEDKCIFTRNLGLIRLKKASIINPETLLFYLWGSIPQQLLNLIATGGTNGQITLTMAELKEFPVPDFSEFFQQNLKEIFRHTEDLIKNSEIKFKEAEFLLLSELGLADWQPKHYLNFIKNYSNTKESERIDPDYYQPKYEEIINAIKNYSSGWDTLRNLIVLKDKNVNPQKKVIYKYIELANISGNGEIMDCMVEEGQELPTRARRKVTTGDVIVSSIEGSLSSIAVIEKDYDQALCSTGFYVINSKQLISEVLLVFLKSIIGQLQLKKGCSGTILTAINKDEFGKIILPKIKVEIQFQIQQKVIESFVLRKQSKHLLECAKKAIEIAIEQDEQTAINWLEDKIRN